MIGCSLIVIILSVHKRLGFPDSFYLNLLQIKDLRTTQVHTDHH
jgi:hypothetical protein